MQEEVLLTSTTTNPFAVDRVTDPFGVRATDVAELNEKAFAMIAQEIRFVRAFADEHGTAEL